MFDPLLSQYQKLDETKQVAFFIWAIHYITVLQRSVLADALSPSAVAELKVYTDLIHKFAGQSGHMMLDEDCYPIEVIFNGLNNLGDKKVKAKLLKGLTQLLENLAHD